MPSCHTGWGSVEEAHWEVQAGSTSGEDPAILGVVQQIWDHMDPTHGGFWQDRGSFIHGAKVLLGTAIEITMITMIFPGSWSHNSEQEQRALPGKRHLVCHYEGGKKLVWNLELFVCIDSQMFIMWQMVKLKIRMTSNAKARNYSKETQEEDEATIRVLMAFMVLRQAFIETW